MSSIPLSHNNGQQQGQQQTAKDSSSAKPLRAPQYWALPNNTASVPPDPSHLLAIPAVPGNQGSVIIRNTSEDWMKLSEGTADDTGDVAGDGADHGMANIIGAGASDVTAHGEPANNVSYTGRPMILRKSYGEDALDVHSDPLGGRMATFRSNFRFNPSARPLPLAGSSLGLGLPLSASNLRAGRPTAAEVAAAREAAAQALEAAAQEQARLEKVWQDVVERAGIAFAHSCLENLSLFWHAGSPSEGVFFTLAHSAIREASQNPEILVDAEMIFQFRTRQQELLKFMLNLARNLLHIYFLTYSSPLVEALGPMTLREVIAFNVASLTLSLEDRPHYVSYLSQKLQRPLDDFQPPLLSFTEDPLRPGLFNHPVLWEVVFRFLSGAPTTEGLTNYESLDVKKWLKLSTYSVYVALMELETGEFVELQPFSPVLEPRFHMISSVIDAAFNHAQTGPEMAAMVTSRTTWGSEVFGRPKELLKVKEEDIRIRPFLSHANGFTFTKPFEPQGGDSANPSAAAVVSRAHRQVLQLRRGFPPHPPIVYQPPGDYTLLF